MDAIQHHFGDQHHDAVICFKHSWKVSSRTLVFVHKPDDYNCSVVYRGQELFLLFLAGA